MKKGVGVGFRIRFAMLDYNEHFLEIQGNPLLLQPKYSDP